jgi:hypothetical protein
MPDVRILQGVSGLDFSWAPGDVVPMEEAQAAAWADGYRAELADGGDPPPTAYDPGEHSVKDVLAYLSTVGDDEAVRVLDAEEHGQDRAGLAKVREQRRAQAEAGAERAADDSRGGGRAEVIETRDE